jgi:hypothetical protein
MDLKRRSELGQQLLDAAGDGDLSAVESLIAQGADVNHTDIREEVSVFPLWCDCYQYIIMCFVRVMQCNQFTALLCASGNGHVVVVKWLLKHGAYIDHQDTFVSYFYSLCDGVGL